MKITHSCNCIFGAERERGELNVLSCSGNGGLTKLNRRRGAAKEGVACTGLEATEKSRLLFVHVLTTVKMTPTSTSYVQFGSFHHPVLTIQLFEIKLAFCEMFNWNPQITQETFSQTAYLPVGIF